jgi:hypothetical protein
MEKLFLDLNEPEDATAWLDAFRAKSRVEKKKDIHANNDTQTERETFK